MKAISFNADLTELRVVGSQSRGSIVRPSNIRQISHPFDRTRKQTPFQVLARGGRAAAFWSLLQLGKEKQLIQLLKRINLILPPLGISGKSLLFLLIQIVKTSWFETCNCLTLGSLLFSDQL